MAELVVRSTLNDAWFWLAGAADEPYASVHDALLCNELYISGWSFSLRQSKGEWLGSLYYQIGRIGLPFNTSPLPDDANVLAVTLSLKMRDEFSSVDTDFDVVVVDGSNLADTPEEADYGRLLSATTTLASKNTADMPEVGDAWYDFPLNAAGIALINKTGITKFGLRSSRDINSQPPPLPPPREQICFYSRNKGLAYAPKLTITYTTTPIPPIPINKAYALAREEL